MDDREAGRYWDRNADAWTRLAREGWDIYRDLLNTPAFLDMLPDVTGLRGLDLGCGEGHNTRRLVDRGATMSAIDISSTFVRHAHTAEHDGAPDIHYAVASAQRLPFANEAFDFATAFMSLMDLPQPQIALTEVSRVLKAGGFLQFSITHPCFDAVFKRLDYFDARQGRIDEWLFSAAPQKAKAGLRPFRVPVFHYTLSEWFNSMVEAGLQIERLAEPRIDEGTALKFPRLSNTQTIPFFLHVRCRKIPRAAMVFTRT